ncbi:protein phosphatase 1 regulatory subunit 27 [Agelaius tricolor]|uniref:protein phosphatase 1 regulatory subunit 27 n=1 Tax=Agelaius tricolor TaxID=9191 RepID=UPI0039F172E6
MPLCLKAAAVSMRDYCPAVPQYGRYGRCTPRYGRYTPRLRASRTVRFPNDVVFQDHIKQGDLEQVGRFIRARKVTLDTIYPSGMAALHEAVLTGNLDCVKLLVKYGADIHQRDENGWTPLHMACSDGYADIARYLLSLGASLEATTDDGEKPSDLIDPEYEDLVQLLGGAALR